MVRWLNVGRTITTTYRERSVETAIFKEPVTAPLFLSQMGFTGDQQTDQVHHGGPDKAVCVYPYAHYPYWAEWFGCEVAPAIFGENLTIEGRTEETVHIGDTYQVGGAQVQVSQPRVPCFKTSVRHSRPNVAEQMMATGYTGFYLRVLQEGYVAPGDKLTLVRRSVGAPTVAFANQIRYHDPDNQSGQRLLLATEGLAEVWRQWLRNKLGE